ncbi:MAG: rhamnulokinase [Culturomica sp.]|jgi:rhamnulokinase|nr:rhamnulokinase [Culturomica sp.]
MRYIAADFGAGSGRVIVGEPTPSGILLEEVHRFPNRQIRLGDTLYWDFPALFEELKTGLKKAFGRYDDILSIGVDTWGVDFGLLDRRGRLLGNPVCYRDARTAGILERVFEKIPSEILYGYTGNQFMEINTAFQLYSLALSEDPQLACAGKLLFMPDLFNYFLSGVPVNEQTIASTSQLYNPLTGEWAKPVLEKLGIPAGILQKIVPAGTVLGELLPEVSAETGGAGARIVAVGSHDTASALASVEAEGENWAFISSGTWSLMGIRTATPILTEEAMKADFTNEVTVDGGIRFLRNITGLWLLQCVMKEWESEGKSREYDALIAEAEQSDFASVIDVDDPLFACPASMQEAICNYCRRSGQEIPRTGGEYMRLIALSLATKYAEVKTKLEECSGRKIDTIHIVGGGSRNRLINRLTEELTGARVVPGAVEATAIGNIRTQIKAMTHL